MLEVNDVKWDRLGLKEIYEARLRIRGKAANTPLLEDSSLKLITGAKDIYHKLECIQPTGSFKLRGATNRIMALSPQERKKGVITFSTGNHGRAVAYVAGKEGLAGYVCMSRRVSENRIKNVQALGAEAIVHGESQDEAEEHYWNLVKEYGYIGVPPFDDPYIISGQGTIALEFLERVPGMDLLLVPLSGGGLLSGVALTAKLMNPRIQVIGVSLETSPVMLESVKQGEPVSLKEKDSIADSLLGGIGKENRYTLNLVRRYVDDHITIGESEIADGMKYMLREHNYVIEGAAAVGVASILAGKVRTEGKIVGTVLTGRTIVPEKYLRLMNELE